MLDSDVARLYHYETKDLNRNVKNNIDRFPEYYCFQLTEEEYNSLRCNFFTLNKNKRGQHRKYMPYVFTEHGITMLAGLLKNELAIQVCLNIINAFIEIRLQIATLKKSTATILIFLTTATWRHIRVLLHTRNFRKWPNSSLFVLDFPPTSLLILPSGYLKIHYFL